MNLKQVLSSLSISGGWAGIMAFVLAIWVIVYWFVDDCSMDSGVNCKNPSSVTNRTNERNVMVIVAAVACIPSFWVLFLAASKGGRRR